MNEYTSRILIRISCVARVLCGVCVYRHRAVGSSGSHYSSVHITAAPPSREPWPSERPSSYDVASPLKQEHML